MNDAVVGQAIKDAMRREHDIDVTWLYGARYEGGNFTELLGRTALAAADKAREVTDEEVILVLSRHRWKIRQGDMPWDEAAPRVQQEYHEMFSGYMKALHAVGLKVVWHEQ